MQKIEYAGERVESGPVQFGEDWPGIFIRGDHALYMGMLLKSHFEHGSHSLYDGVLKNFAEELLACDVRNQAQA